MGSDADGRSDFVDRFVILRKKMCQISEAYPYSGQTYIDMLTGALTDLGLGCVMEVFPPVRVPSSCREPDMYSAARIMEIADMRSGLIIRFNGRAVDTDRKSAELRSLESVLKSAGMIASGEFEEFRLLDIRHSEYSRNFRMLGPEVSYVSI